MFDISTGTEDFIADGVVSHNCFARKTHTYLDMDAGRDFEREIVVKVNVPELVRAEVARPSWKRDLVALGTNTDPYQWCESRYRMMPEILEALLASGTPVSVLTKSPLVMRDVEIFERFRDARAEGVGEPLGADPRRERLAGDRAAHAEPVGAASTRSPSCAGGASTRGS